MLKKTAIRKNIVQLLKDNIPSMGNRVFGGRILPNSKDDLFPFIAIYNKTDSVEEDFVDHTLRTLDVNIVVSIKHNSNDTLTDLDFDEVVENAQQDVEVVISRILGVNNLPNDPFKLFEEITYTSSTTSHNDASGDNIGQALINYTIKYSVQRPVEVSTLEDFDEVASYQNIDIIELRPLQGITP